MMRVWKRSLILVAMNWLCKFKKLLSLREVVSKIDYTNKNDKDNFPMQHNAKIIERFKYTKEG